MQQREIIARNVAHQRQYHRLPRILRRQQFRARSLRRAPQLAEKVQLKRGIARKCQKIEFGLKVMFFSAAEISVARHLREQIRTRDLNLCAACVDPLRRQLQVVVLLQRRADQLL